jgi:hypothetical protein
MPWPARSAAAARYALSPAMSVPQSERATGQFGASGDLPQNGHPSFASGSDCWTFPRRRSEPYRSPFRHRDGGQPTRKYRIEPMPRRLGPPSSCRDGVNGCLLLNCSPQALPGRRLHASMWSLSGDARSCWFRSRAENTRWACRTVDPDGSSTVPRTFDVSVARISVADICAWIRRTRRPRQPPVARSSFIASVTVDVTYRLGQHTFGNVGAGRRGSGNL